MPFTLREDFPDGTWSHNSAGEHAQKHFGDLSEINHLRAGRDESPLDSEALYDRMYRGGVITVYDKPRGVDVGNLIGYVVSEKSREVVDVNDFFVVPERRGAGIGGAILGKLLTHVTMVEQVRGITAFPFRKQLVIDGREIVMPGYHMIADEFVLGPQIERFKASLPAGWSGIRTILADDDQPTTHEVYQGGEVAGTISGGIYGDNYQIQGHGRRYPHILFAAIDLLNPDVPVPQSVEND
jgi:GNAT superfamily N-acetyltransferase